jgi:hypothetical protein
MCFRRITKITYKLKLLQDIYFSLCSLDCTVKDAFSRPLLSDDVYPLDTIVLSINMCESQNRESSKFF